MQVDKWLDSGKLKLLYKAAFSPYFLNSSSEHEVRERTGGKKKRERGRKEERKKKRKEKEREGKEEEKKKGMRDRGKKNRRTLR